MPNANHCSIAPRGRSTGRNVAVIPHPPGEEIQFDWLELPDPPKEWGVGEHAHLLVGALAHGGRWRAGDAAGFRGFPAAAQRWWRTVPDGLSVSQAQSGVDKLAHRMDERRRRIGGVATTVDELAKFEAYWTSR